MDLYTTDSPLMSTESVTSYNDYWYDYYEFPTALLIGDIIWYLQFFFITFGTGSNLMAIVVLIHRIRRKKRGAMDIFLLCVSICDLIFLIGYSLQNILQGLNEPIFLDWETNCNLVNPANLITSQMSALLIMMVTLNRFVAVYFPFKSREFQSTKVTVTSIAVLLLVVLSFNWLYFGGVVPVDEPELEVLPWHLHCQGRNDAIYYYKEMVYVFVDITFYLILPTIVILTFNIAIVVKVLMSSTSQGGGVQVADSRERQKVDLEKTLSTKVKSSSVVETSEDEDQRAQVQDQRAQVEDQRARVEDQRAQVKDKRAQVYIVENENKENPTEEKNDVDAIKQDTHSNPKTNDEEATNTGANTKAATSDTKTSTSGKPTTDIQGKKRGSLVAKKPAKKIRTSTLSKNVVRLTRVCLVLSTSFLIVAISALFNILGDIVLTDRFFFQVFSRMTGVLISVNHSINFLLYCLTSQTFRSDIKDMFVKKK